MEGKRTIIGDAIRYAAIKHVDQTRINGDAYILHPLAVFQEVKKQGYGEAYQVAALLHDVLEDTDATEEELRELFGDEVTDAVILLTRIKGMDEAEYVSRILENHIAAVVKNVDKINNLNDAVACGKTDFAAGYIEKAKKFYYKKFSIAMDMTIRDSEFILNQNIKAAPTMDSIKDYQWELYIDKDPKNEPPTEKPALDYSDVKFFDCDMGETFYCVYDWPGEWMKAPKTWLLTPSGWKPTETNLKEWLDDIAEISKEAMLQEIECLKQEGWFTIQVEDLWQ